MPTLHTYTDAAAFLAVTAPLFRTDEVRHGLIYGIAERLRQNPGHFQAAPYLATVDDDGRLAAATLMTPPHNLLVVAADDEPAAALTQIAQNLIAHGWTAPGVNGVSAWSHAFAAIWCRLTGATAAPRMELRVFELRQVYPPTGVPGHMRPAADADLDLVLAWYTDFQIDAHVNDPPPRAEVILQRIQEQSIFLWDDGGAGVAGRCRPAHAAGRVDWAGFHAAGAARARLCQRLRRRAQPAAAGRGAGRSARSSPTWATQPPTRFTSRSAIGLFVTLPRFVSPCE
jgi:hypothetical protein